MSKFSGKCDFCDTIEICGLEKILNSKIYLGKSEIPLEIKSLEDCIPYYPHIVTASFFNKDRCVIYLSEKSWVDIEEERYGHTLMQDRYRKYLQEELEKYGKKD